MNPKLCSIVHSQSVKDTENVKTVLTDRSSLKKQFP